MTQAMADEAALQRQVDELAKIVQELRAEIAASKADFVAATQKAAAAEKKADAAARAADQYATQQDIISVRDEIGDQLDRRLLVGSAGGVRLNAAAAVRYTDTQANNVTGGSSSFTVPFAQIGFSGSLRSDPVDEGDVTYAAALIYYGAGLNTTRITNTWVNWNIKSLGKAEVEPAYTLGLRLGQQPVFFGNDNVAGEELRPTINGAAYLGAFPNTDLGLVASGGFNWNYDAAAPADQTNIPTIGYTLGVFNGSNAVTNAVDINYNKAILGKLVYAPFTKYNDFFQGLKIGASHLRWDDATHEKHLNSVHVEWLKLPILATAEYVWGTDEPLAGGPDIDKDGFLATLFYRPGKLPDFEPLVRFERWNSNHTLTKKGRRDITTLGFNYYWWQVDPIVRRTYSTVATERVIKLQVNYNIIDDAVLGSGNQFITQVVFNF